MMRPNIQSVFHRAVFILCLCVCSRSHAQRVDPRAPRYVPLSEAVEGAGSRFNQSDHHAFSNAAVYRDSNKLHSLPFSILAVVESRYDILRISALFHEFSQKFPKKPYVAVIAVELPRRNDTMRQDIESNGTEAFVPSLRLKNFLNFLKFKEHASIDLSYLQYEASLSAEINHHLFHYMLKMTAMPDLLLTVGASTTAVTAGVVARLFKIPVFQITNGCDGLGLHATNDQALLDQRHSCSVADLHATRIIGGHGPIAGSGGKRNGHREKFRHVGSLLYDTIHGGLSLSTQQLKLYRDLLAGGTDVHQSRSAAVEAQQPYLVVGCAYACSNMIDSASLKKYVRAVTHLASVHSERTLFLLLDEVRPEYTFYSGNHSHFDSKDGNRLSAISRLFAGSPNVRVMDTVADYAVYVYLILHADLYVADCDMAEGFIQEEVLSLGVKAVFLSLPPNAVAKCPSLNPDHGISMVDVYTTGDSGRSQNNDVLLAAARDTLRGQSEVSIPSSVGDGYASMRAACFIASYFFAQGLPNYLTKYCGSVSDELLIESEAANDRNEVTVVFRNVQLRSSNIAANLAAIFAFDGEALDSEDSSFLSRVRRVAVLYQPASDTMIGDDEDMVPLFTEAGLCCMRTGLTSFSCGRSMRLEDNQLTCLHRSVDVSFERLVSDSMVYEFDLIRAVVTTPLVIVIDNAIHPKLTTLRHIIGLTSEHSAVSGSAGFIIGKDQIYTMDTSSSGEAVEVDFVQGIWGMRSEWLKVLLAGAAQERKETLPSIHVYISSFLWSHLRVRTFMPTQSGLNNIQASAILSPFEARRSCRRAVEFGFVPCGLRAGHPQYGGERCCAGLGGALCQATYHALYGHGAENEPSPDRDNLQCYLQ